jgi:hypothetical protein
MKRFATVAVVGAASALLLAGCSTSTTLDGAKAETTIAADLGTQVGGTWTVQCPDSIPLQKDLVTNCMATNADGQSVNINMTQTDDQGNVSWETVQ